MRLTVLLVITIFLSCQPSGIYDLAITNINIYDSETKTILTNRSILIQGDTIVGIIEGDEEINSINILDGKHRLACAGFVDTHIHLSDIFGGYDGAPENLQKDSISRYEEKLANEYLIHGVTTVRDAGHSEQWLDVSMLLQKEPKSSFPNTFISGAALISDEGKEPYKGHSVVSNNTDIREKILDYYDRGIMQVKLYWRLREPELKSVIHIADSLGMNIYGHFDNNVVSIPNAMDYKIRHFEHVMTIFKSVFDYGIHWEEFRRDYILNFDELSFGPLSLEIIRFVDSNPELQQEVKQLIRDMASQGTSLSTSVHIFGSYIDRARLKTRIQVDMEKGKAFHDLSDEQKVRLDEDFKTLMAYCRIAHESGVELCIGTDCPNGGKALLSELMLLYEAGIPMDDVLEIATINGANAINQEKNYGSIKVGKKADIVIFENDPFEDHFNLLSGKTVIKGGRIFGKEQHIPHTENQ